MYHAHCLKKQPPVKYRIIIVVQIVDTKHLITIVKQMLCRMHSDESSDSGKKNHGHITPVACMSSNSEGCYTIFPPVIFQELLSISIVMYAFK